MKKCVYCGEELIRSGSSYFCEGCTCAYMERDIDETNLKTLDCIAPKFLPEGEEPYLEEYAENHFSIAIPKTSHRLNILKIPAGIEKISQIESYGNRLRPFTTIVIPEGVVEIEDGAFLDCTKLRNLVLPSTIAKIGDFAFACTSVYTLIFPDTPIMLGTGVFYGANVRRILQWPKRINALPVQTFFGCNGLKIVELPDSIEKIGKDAFAYCRNLTKIKLPKELERIGKAAFRETKLTSIRIPAATKHIAKDAFRDCSALTEIIIESDKVPEGAPWGAENAKIYVLERS